MKQSIAIIVFAAIVAAFMTFLASNEYSLRVAAESRATTAESRATDYEATNAGLVKQLNESDAEKEAKSKELADIKDRDSKLGDRGEKAVAELDKNVKAIQKERDDALGALVDAKDELVKARFKLDNQTCPAPDFSPYTSKIADLEKQLAELKPKPKKKAEPAKSTLAASMAEAADSGRLLVATFSQDKCLEPGKPCDTFNRNVLSQSALAESIGEVYVLCDLNIDHDDIGTVKVHSTPAVGIYDPKAKKWLRFFSPSKSLNGFISQLSSDGEETIEPQETSGGHFRRWSF